MANEFYEVVKGRRFTRPHAAQRPSHLGASGGTTRVKQRRNANRYSVVGNVTITVFRKRRKIATQRVRLHDISVIGAACTVRTLRLFVRRGTVCTLKVTSGKLAGRFFHGCIRRVKKEHRLNTVIACSFSFNEKGDAENILGAIRLVQNGG